MTWTIKIRDGVRKTIQKLDQQNRSRIVNFLNRDLLLLDNPRQSGKALTGKFKGMWRYRVGDYRIICEIIDDELVVVAIEVEHRSKVYK